MNEIQVPAIALEQAGGRTIYAFGIDGKQVPSFACVSRVKRDDAGTLWGYQRPEVRQHIAEIRRYIESDDPMIPNAVVLAFDSRVAFIPSPRSKSHGPSTTGTLRIPIVDDGNVPGWIVDGQQRVAAIREASVSSFPIFAVAFIAGDETEQREQFVLVNATKPLPKTLIYELLPGVRGRLPTALEERKVASQLVSRLSHDSGSPLKGIVRSTTNPGGRIQATSLIRATENSLRDGVLYRIGLTEQGAADVDDALSGTLSQFWAAVRETWADIWELGPRRSRLVHGAGVVTLGFLMDAIADRRRDGAWPDEAFFNAELLKLRPHCRWNEGYWEFGPELRRRWDELQNTPRDVQVLSNHLLRVYRRL